MALKDIVKVNRKTFFDPRAWLDFDSLKQQTGLVWGIVKQAFVTEQPGTPETFEEAKTRLSLNEDDIKAAGENYFLFAIMFLVSGIMLFLFSLYLLFSGSFLGFLLALALCAFLFGQTFRNHFLYFQIKHRKLGCTYEEWRKGRINEEGPAE